MSHPLPHLLRSPLLWLGLPGLVFLIWAWSNSVTTVSTLLIGRESSFVELRSREGVIGIATCSDSPILFSGWTFETQTIRTPCNFFSPPAFNNTPSGRNHWAMEVAYWVVIPLYFFILWILALGLHRWRGKRRSAAALPDVPRGTP